MNDEEIIALYNERSENAISETAAKYGGLCRSISAGIVGDKNDCEEIVNDTWKALWDTIPPKNPDSFKAYVCRVAKNLSLKRYEHSHAIKRKSEYDMSLDELGDIISTDDSTLDSVGQRELSELINKFLGELPKGKRVMFLRRYWFSHSVKQIASDNGMSEKNASMCLARIRQKLKNYLESEGYML